jgi:hypothetical protein
MPHRSAPAPAPARRGSLRPSPPRRQHRRLTAAGRRVLPLVSPARSSRTSIERLITSHFARPITTPTEYPGSPARWRVIGRGMIAMLALANAHRCPRAARLMPRGPATIERFDCGGDAEDGERPESRRRAAPRDQSVTRAPYGRDREACNQVKRRVGGATHTPSTCAPWEAWLVAA